MNSTIKSVVFWFAIIVAAFAIYQFSSPTTPDGARAQARATVEGEWLFAGDPKLTCAIFRQGSTLLVVNERGDVASARLESENRLAVVKGNGWESGVTAEIRDGGRVLAWRDGSVWTRRSDKEMP